MMAVALSPRTNLHALPEQQSLHLPCSVSPTRLLPALLNSPPGTARCSTSGQKRPTPRDAHIADRGSACGSGAAVIGATAGVSAATAAAAANSSEFIRPPLPTAVATSDSESST